MAVAFPGSVWDERNGPSGTLGSNTIAQLLEAGYAVTPLVNGRLVVLGAVNALFASLLLPVLVLVVVLVLGMLSSRAKLYARSRTSGGDAALRATRAAVARGSGARLSKRVTPPCSRCGEIRDG